MRKQKGLKRGGIPLFGLLVACLLLAGLAMANGNDTGTAALTTASGKVLTTVATTAPEVVINQALTPNKVVEQAKVDGKAIALHQDVRDGGNSQANYSMVTDGGNPQITLAVLTYTKSGGSSAACSNCHAPVSAPATAIPVQRI